MAYTNSSLVSYTKLSPNHSGQRTHSIDRITPHCVVGQLSAESICGCFTSTSRQASCNYGIGTDGRVSLCVEEKNRSWCSSSNANDQRAVTIECASDMNEPYTCSQYSKVPVGKLCTTQHRINEDVVLSLVSEMLKAIAEYRSQESRHSCRGHCKGSVRSRQQFTAERADERSTNSMNITYTQNGDYLIPNIIIRKTKPLGHYGSCLLYTSPSPRDMRRSRMPSSA